MRTGHVLNLGIHNALKRLQAETAAELDALLDRAFKGELVTSEAVEIQPARRQTVPQLEFGIVLPSTAENIIEFRAALDAFIVNHLRYDKHLGRTKIEKVNHFIEFDCGVNLYREPVRDAAGPVDIHSRLAVEAKAKEPKWFSVFENRNYGKRYEYIPGKNSDVRLR